MIYSPLLVEKQRLKGMNEALFKETEKQHVFVHVSKAREKVLSSGSGNRAACWSMIHPRNGFVESTVFNSCR